MPKDIRSFFTTTSKKPSTTSNSDSSKPAPVETKKSKRKANVSSSDDDIEVVEASPAAKKADPKKRRIIDSDEEQIDTNKNVKKDSKTSEIKKEDKYKDLKPVDVNSFFSSKPIERIDKPKTSHSSSASKSTNSAEVVKSHSSSEKSKEHKKDSQRPSSAEKPKEAKRDSHKTPEKKANDNIRKESGSKNSKEKVQNGDIEKKEKKESPRTLETKKWVDNGSKSEKKESRTPEKKKAVDNGSKSEKKTKIETETSPKTPKTDKKMHVDDKEPSVKTPNLNNSALTDEERHERKRMAAMLYNKFKARGGPTNPGSKEIPKGKPNCLINLNFIVTGTLDSMERDEAAQVIKDFGGKVMTTVSKKLNYMVVGLDAGPAKLAKAEEFGIKQISEDELFDLIREKSGMKVEKPKEDPKKIKDEKTKHSPSKEKEKTKTISSKEKEKTPKKEVNIKEEKTSAVKNGDSHKRKKTEESDVPVKVKKERTETSEAAPSKVKKEKTEEIAPMEREVTQYQKDIASTNNMAWVDKYKPTSIKTIIGQSGATSNVQKLLNWLQKWNFNHDGNKKHAKPNPWAKNDDGAAYKAALLSGPPGVGKTTTATLVCKELGFDAVEFNASDTRSKKLLKEEVSELLTNNSLFGYFHGSNEKVSKKHVLLMDEVDGMSGNEDRGGMAELIQLIKDSNVPVICMCNDRTHPKMRSLVNHCFDLRFQKPRVEQIRGAMMSVCFKEGMKVPPAVIDEIIAGTGNDVRQTLNHLALYSAGKMDIDIHKAKKDAEKSKKDVKIGPWDVIRRVFTAEDQKNMTMNDKSDLFFHDYSIAPLFVQENYLKVLPKAPKSEHLDLIAKTADTLSFGDTIDKRIRSNMAWSLLPVQAMFSSVLPGEYMSGHFTGQINFPGWLGKNSKTTKRKRLAQEIHDHTRVKTSGSRLSVRLDYAQFLLAAILRPLKENGMDGVEASLNVIKEYRLLREDIDSLIELTSWPRKKTMWDEIDGKVKAALTRAYNKEVQPYSYSAVNAVKKKASRAQESDEMSGLYGEEGEGESQTVESEDEKEDDNLESNAFIKVKKKGGSTAGSSKAGSSKTAKKEPKAKAGTSKGKKK